MRLTEGRPTMNRATRRDLMKVIGASSVGGTLAGCIGDDEEIVIRMNSQESAPGYQDAVEEAFDDWAETIDENVDRDFTYYGIGESATELRNSMAVDDPPELVMIDSGQAGTWSERLTDVSETIENVNPIEEVQLEYDGNMVFAPVYLTIDNMWVRTDIYEQAGISEDDIPQTIDEAWTWEENLEILGDINESTDIFPSVVHANGEVPVVHYYWGWDLYMNGVDIAERSGPDFDDIEVVLDHEPNKERAIEALEYNNDQWEREFTPNTVNYEWGDLIDGFVTESFATSYYGGRLLHSTYDRAPDLVENLAPGVVEVPQRVKDGDSNYFTPLGARGFIVPETDHADLTKDFVKYFFDEGYLIDTLLTVPTQLVPPDLDLLWDEDYQNNEIIAENQDYLELLEEVAPHLTLPQNLTEHPTPFYRDWVEMGTLIMPDEMARAFTGRKSPSDAVEDAADRLRDSLPDYEDR